MSPEMTESHGSRNDREVRLARPIHCNIELIDIYPLKNILLGSQNYYYDCTKYTYKKYVLFQALIIYIIDLSHYRNGSPTAHHLV